MSTELIIDYRPIDGLATRARNPRTHSEAQIKQLMRSIEQFGFTNPVLIDETGTLIAGHGRVEAAKRLGQEQVPTICLADMSEVDIRAYVIADNKLAENAGWDHKLLALELGELNEIPVDYNLSLTGFELPEIDVLLQSYAGIDGGGEADDPADSVPAVAEGEPVTRLGDIWQIGDHRLICGDSTQPDTYETLLGEERASLVFADAPYNVPVSGHVCGSGKVQHREFQMASGEMSEAQFEAFLYSVFSHLVAYSADGSMHFQCMDWRHLGEMLRAGRDTYDELKNLCVWTKTNGGMGSLYRSQHELVFVFKSGSGPHINNVELGKHGRNRTNVWTYPGVNSFGAHQSDLALHPTVKPTALVRDAVLDCSRRGDII
ncbi:MAG: site-specific DNA-methyltransferase, partial [Pseudomonadota bacterium]